MSHNSDTEDNGKKDLAMPNKAMKLEFFSEGKIALAREITQHKELQDQLIADMTNDEGVRIGIIAAYVLVVMDGTYTQDDLERLYPILIEKLREKRKIRIVSHSPRKIAVSDRPMLLPASTYDTDNTSEESGTIH